MSTSLIRISPPRTSGLISRGRSALVFGSTGFIEHGGESGLWVRETRLLSLQRWTVNGSAPALVTASNVEPHEWLGYFITAPPELREKGADPPQQTLEVRLRRFVGEGLYERIAVVNHTQSKTRFVLALDVEVDFDDWSEVSSERKYARRVTRYVEDDPSGPASLVFDCQAGAVREELGERRSNTIRRRLSIAVERSDVSATYTEQGLRFRVELSPHELFRAEVTYIAEIEGIKLPLARPEPRGVGPPNVRGGELLGPPMTTLSSTMAVPSVSNVLTTFERARTDLLSLHLPDLDHDAGSLTLAAGTPGYLGVFGRDSLITGWQAMLVDPRFSVGALRSLSRNVGTTQNDFRDEQPDKLLHEVHLGPLAALGLSPQGRYYGGVSATLEYPAFVASLWNWTGDERLVRPFLPTAHKALAWAARHGDLDGDGFIEYERRSPSGPKNQAWKDSGDAIVYADGSQVPDPLGTSEMQGTLYASLASFAELLTDLGDRDEGRRLAHEAAELRKRFNDAYFMDDEDFYAMGMDHEKRLIRSIASNGGHALTTGIADEALAPRVAARLLAPDLFSGWGVRTLSSAHPAYDPWSYHRGSVWPAENAFLVYGLARWGFYSLMHDLSRALFEAAGLFPLHRLPEVFAGHPRDGDHPFPGIYPRANSPQSWSASAVVLLIRSMLGIAPYAPLDLLLVDPHLPEWLPDITLHAVRVGRSACTLRFFRTQAGVTEMDVLDVRGPLRIVRHPGALRTISRAAQVRAAR